MTYTKSIRHRDKQTDRQKSIQVDGRMDSKDLWIVTQTGRNTIRWVNRQTDLKIDKNPDGNTNR
jgi:hypothetical protein